MDLFIQPGNLFAAKPEMNCRRTEGLYLRYGRIGHFLAYYPT